MLHVARHVRTLVVATETGSMYDFQAGSTHPTGMLSGCSLIFVAAQGEH